MRPSTIESPPRSPRRPPSGTGGASSSQALAQFRGETVDLPRPQLVGNAVGDEASGALEDLLAHLEVVLFQGAAGGDEVDDAVGEADQRRQLDRALDLDHFHLATG